MDVPSKSDSKDTMDETDGNIVTMVDVLAEEKELEDDAHAVLGGADDKMCTYSQGYMSRQPLYACATCIPPDDKQQQAGICLACCYHCHEGHDLTELYTKRNFRCDCGNSKFQAKCNLEPVKDDLNDKNEYNQNFRGVYCTCSRPYPDPEDTVADEMIQCVVCEDWYHGRHLEGENHSQFDYAEVVCQTCSRKHPFLRQYPWLLAKKSAPEGTAAENGEAVKPEGSEGCLVAGSKEGAKEGALLWKEGWRQHLCRCPACLALYEERGVSFLLDDADTVQHYEEQGKGKAEGGYEKGMRALSELDRVQQVEAIQGYNQMKTELMAYLHKFAANGKVVREEDIKDFFGQMQARKRQRVEMPPYHCR